MEEKKLNLDAPFISVRRIPTTSENTKKTRTKKVKGLSQETLIRLLKDDQKSFDHVVKITASVPFLWEQTPGKPKIHMATTLIKESSLNKALDIVSSTNVIRDDVILEHRDLILPATKEFAMKQKKESSLDQEEKMKKKKKKKQSMTLQKVHLPRICSKDSLSVDVLNPVLSRVRTCNNTTVKSIDYRLNVTEPLSNKVMSKSHLETSREISKISISRNTSRLQRTMSNHQLQSRDTRLLVEEVKRRRSNINKNRSRNISGIVYQPPLLKTPSESWLCRTLPRSSLASVNSDQVAGFMKMERKDIPQSIKWETIVKTSYPTLRS